MALDQLWSGRISSCHGESGMSEGYPEGIICQKGDDWNNTGKVGEEKWIN